MLNVIRHYAPFLVWLLLAAFALTPTFAHSAQLLGEVRAEQPVKRIGYVSGAAGPTFDAFRQGLRDAGYVEGRDIVLETRFSEGRAERFPQLIAEVLARGVDVLVAGSPPGVTAAIQAQARTPVVAAGVADPAGIARRLGKPSTHITGTSLASEGVAGEWVRIAAALQPGINRVAVLVNPEHPSRATWSADMQQAAAKAGVRLDLHEVRQPRDLDVALLAIGDGGAQALIVTGDPMFLAERKKIAGFAEDCKLPAIYFSALFPEAGGLVAYGASLEASYRRSAAFVDRILRGAQPVELAIEPVPPELVVNLRAARALGIALPDALVRRADRVIQ